MRPDCELAEPPQSVTKSRHRRVRNIAAGQWGTFFALLAAWSRFGSPTPPGGTPRPAGWASVPHESDSPRPSRTQDVPPALFQFDAEPRPRFAAKPIRDIQPIADRVIAQNPEAKRGDSAETELAELTDEEFAELAAELAELLDNEPLPVLIDGLDDESELVAFNDDEEEDETTAVEPTKAEQLFDELLVVAQSLNSQPNRMDRLRSVRS